jgi:nucleoside-diphosphate-sugar epimerase
MRVLVTGGTGYLGGSIVRALHHRGHHPVVFARRASTAGLPGVAYDGDVRDRKALELAAAHVDAIIHAAALVSMWRPVAREFDEVNVGGLLNVLDVARSRGMPRIIYTSSFLALPPAGTRVPLEANDYQRTKVRALERARAAAAGGAPMAIMFPGVIYGPGADTEGNLVGRLVRDHMTGRLPGLIGADRPWSYAYVTDVAGAHVDALERPCASGEYVLGGENAPQRRVFEIVREVTRRPLPRRLPFAVARAVALVEDTRASWFGRQPLLTRGTVEILRRDWSLDSSRSIAELNYRPTPLAVGVRLLLNSL